MSCFTWTTFFFHLIFEVKDTVSFSMCDKRSALTISFHSHKVGSHVVHCLSLLTCCNDSCFFFGHFLFILYSLLLTLFQRGRGNASCHKPVDPNLWWLATQARVYRYVSAGPGHHTGLPDRALLTFQGLRQALPYVSGAHPAKVRLFKETRLRTWALNVNLTY